MGLAHRPQLAAERYHREEPQRELARAPFRLVVRAWLGGQASTPERPHDLPAGVWPRSRSAEGPSGARGARATGSSQENDRPERLHREWPFDGAGEPAIEAVYLTTSTARPRTSLRSSS